jgi:hypothetical protein
MLNRTAVGENMTRQATMDRWVEIAEARRACVQATAEENLRLVTPTLQTASTISKLCALMRLNRAHQRRAVTPTMRLAA